MHGEQVYSILITSGEYWKYAEEKERSEYCPSCMAENTDTDGTKFIETKGNLFDKLKKAVKQTFGSADKTKRQGAQAYIDVIEGMNRGARLVLEPGRQYLIGRQ